MSILLIWCWKYTMTLRQCRRALLYYSGRNANTATLTGTNDGRMPLGILLQGHSDRSGLAKRLITLVSTRSLAPRVNLALGSEGDASERVETLASDNLASNGLGLGSHCISPRCRCA